jgi:hypothetical protein
MNVPIIVASKSNLFSFRNIVITIGILGCILFPSTVLAGGLAEPTSQLPVHTSDQTTTIGRLSWEITETSTGMIIGRGSRFVTMNEVQVITDTRRELYLEQRIPLSNGFYLKLNAGRNEKPFTGFGMAAGKTDQQTFCWEWFRVAAMKPNFAKKLQESGELEFEPMKIGDHYEVAETRFLSDISMRVIDWTRQDKNSTDSTWRVKILEGSKIQWPTFADNRVMTATNAESWHAKHPPRPTIWANWVKAATETSKSTISKSNP